MEIIWTDLAKASVRKIAQYVECHFSRRVAEEVVQGIYHSVQPLSTAPYLGRALLDWEQYGDIRCIVYKQNQIYYKVCEHHITIMLVWDGRQNPDVLQDLIYSFLTQV